MLTEGNGLPLAFLVTAANVAEVTVGLKVVDRVGVRPDLKDVPGSVQPVWELTGAMTVLISDVDCDDGGFSPPYLGGSGPTAVVSLAVLPRFMRLASSGGRWNGVMAG